MIRLSFLIVVPLLSLNLGCHPDQAKDLQKADEDLTPHAVHCFDLYWFSTSQFDHVVNSWFDFGPDCLLYELYKEGQPTIHLKKTSPKGDFLADSLEIYLTERPDSSNLGRKIPIATGRANRSRIVSVESSQNPEQSNVPDSLRAGGRQIELLEAGFVKFSKYQENGLVEGDPYTWMNISEIAFEFEVFVRGNDEPIRGTIQYPMD